MENRPSIKRFLLYMVVGGLVLAALIGIYVLLFGTFGPTEERILLTTLGISYFSVTSLACAAVYEKKRQGLLALPGLALSVIGLALFSTGHVGRLVGDRCLWQDHCHYRHLLLLVRSRLSALVRHASTSSGLGLLCRRGEHPDSGCNRYCDDFVRQGRLALAIGRGRGNLGRLPLPVYPDTSSAGR